eukprot:1326326-Pleurochrysis_carterae.AAC.1
MLLQTDFTLRAVACDSLRKRSKARRGRSPELSLLWRSYTVTTCPQLALHPRIWQHKRIGCVTSLMRRTRPELAASDQARCGAETHSSTFRKKGRPQPLLGPIVGVYVPGHQQAYTPSQTKQQTGVHRAKND